MKCIEELKRIAEAATPGAWSDINEDHHSDLFSEKGDQIAHILNEDCRGRANYNYIAAFNPSTVLALLSDLERMREYIGSSASNGCATASGILSALKFGKEAK